MNCFGNNRPKITSSDRTKNLQAKTIYKSNVRSFQQRGGNQCNSFNGHVGFYRNGLLRNVRSYDKKQLMQRGFSLCVDGAYSRKPCNNPNLEKYNGIGQNLQRGLYACPRTNLISSEPVKITMGLDSVYNQFIGSDLHSANGCNPLSGFRTMETWDNEFVANNRGNPPWNNFFGDPPREEWETDNERRVLDPSGNTIPLSTTVIDPDNTLFGTDFCENQLSPGEGPMRYLTFARSSHFDIVQGQIFDPTGTQYSAGGGEAMGCDFKEKGDGFGNKIRIPKKGDLAIAGLGSLLDMNSNISQVQNVTQEWLQTAWAHLPGKTGLSLYDHLKKIVETTGPSKSPGEEESDINDYVGAFRQFLIAMSWSFQWFTGIGVVDKVCCIDEQQKIWRIIVKSFWGDMHPPEDLPADVTLLGWSGGTGQAMAWDSLAWRGDKAASSEFAEKAGGVYATDTGPNWTELYKMANNIAEFPGPLSSFPGVFNIFSKAATLNAPSGWPSTPINPLDAVSITGLSLQEFAALGQNLHSTSFPPSLWPLTNYGGLTAADGSTKAPSAEVTTSLFPAPAPPPPPETYSIPIEWEVLYLSKALKIVRWGLFPTLFAGYKPAGKKFEQSIYGGGIGFIAQSEISAYYKKLLGTGVAPIAIMGYQNTSSLRWGSAAEDPATSDDKGCMARNAMLIDNAAQPDVDGEKKWQYKLTNHAVGAPPAVPVPTDPVFGLWILQWLVKKPYAVQKAAGSCDGRNLAYGNNTRQNYIVSYSEKAGKINFTTNQKLYTNFVS